MEEVYRLHELMLNVSVVWGNRTYTIVDLCVHPDPDTQHICRYYSVLDFWHFNLSQIQADPNPHATVSVPDQQTDFQQPLLRNLVVGGMEFSENGTLSAAMAFKALIYVHAPLDAFSRDHNLEMIIDAWETAFEGNITEFSKHSPLIDVYLVLQVRKDNSLASNRGCSPGGMETLTDLPMPISSSLAGFPDG